MEIKEKEIQSRGLREAPPPRFWKARGCPQGAASHGLPGTQPMERRPGEALEAHSFFLSDNQMLRRPG